MGDALAKAPAAPMLPAALVPSSVEDVFRLGEALARAQGFVPSSYLGKPHAIAACVMTGLELGMAPMEALRSLHIVEGRPTMAADVMLARAIRAGIRHTWEHSDAREARLRLERPGFAPYTQRWTLDDARAAGLVGKGNWSKYAAAMLRARCISAAMRAYCPDVLGSAVYVHGEIEPEPVPGSSGSAELRELGRLDDDPEPVGAHAAPPELLSALDDAMRELEECVTAADVEAWVARWWRVIAREPASTQKNERWETIKRLARGVTPPVKATELRALFSAEAAKAKAKASEPQQHQDPARPDPIERAMDELLSVETLDSLRAWTVDNRDALRACGRDDVWASIAAHCEMIGVDSAEVDAIVSGE